MMNEWAEKKRISVELPIHAHHPFVNINKFEQPLNVPKYLFSLTIFTIISRLTISIDIYTRNHLVLRDNHSVYVIWILLTVTAAANVMTQVWVDSGTMRYGPGRWRPTPKTDQSQIYMWILILIAQTIVSSLKPSLTIYTFINEQLWQHLLLKINSVR